jgi:ABC-type branched-subunit amino acid transport system substrate-binding protein
MYGGMDATAGLFAKQARQLGMHASIVTGDGACTGTLAELAGPASENVICSEVGLPLERMSGGENFEANYERRFGHPVLTLRRWHTTLSTSLLPPCSARSRPIRRSLSRRCLVPITGA